MIGDDVDNRADEEEHGQLEYPALHGIILRVSFPLPAAFGTTGGEVTTQVVAAFDAEATLVADEAAQCERAKRQQPQNRSVEDCIDHEAGPKGAIPQN